MPNRSRSIVVLILIVGLFAGGYIVFVKPKSSVKTPVTSTSTTTKEVKTDVKAGTTTVPTFDKTSYSLTDSTSPWVIVNKQHPLNPKSYVPSDLTVPKIPLRVPGNETMQVRAETATALEALVAAAKKDGLSLMLSSGYRSYTYQVGLYGGYVQSMGQASADKQSARPGYSEHQSGFAADLEPISKTCELDQCFGKTPEGLWLAANAYQYGFIIRYPSDKTAVTGYEYEPWHVRYIGVNLATEMHRTNTTTLEEFFTVTGGESY
jgi:D-alanyl-D-alanine carboxypeptidase